MLRRLFVLLALLGLVFQTFGSVAAAWVCEGKTCSTSLLTCCCVAPPANRDDTCRATRIKGKPCVGKCGCKLTVKSVRTAMPTTLVQKSVVPSTVDLPAIVAPTFELPPLPALTYAPVLPNPPPSWIAPPLVEGAPLRAPPVLFV